LGLGFSNKPFETQIGVGRVIKGWDEGEIEKQKECSSECFNQILFAFTKKGVCKLSLGQEAKLIISSDYVCVLLGYNYGLSTDAFFFFKGYGASGAGGRIPPNADLIFEVKLLEINGKKAA